MDQYHEVLEGKVRRGTGAKKVKYRDKKLAHVGGYPIRTKLSNEELRIRKRGRGGNIRMALKRAKYVNVSIGGKTYKVEIKRVLQSNNPDFTRQNIIVKGAIVETEKGKVRITSRPGQHGVVNGVLIGEAS